MKKIGLFFIGVCLGFCQITYAGGASGSCDSFFERNMNDGWKFVLSDIPEAIAPTFEDNEWRSLDLPHDWAFENGFSKEGAQGDKGGYASGGIGWYRKHFDWTDKFDGKKVFLDFDAVYMNSEVWINGQYLGKRPYGYISFSYEITDCLRKGDNVIAVRVDNSLEPSARWYHGCGIYGNVRMRIENRMHFVKDGIFVYNKSVSERRAELVAEWETSGKGTSSVNVLIYSSGIGCKTENKILEKHLSEGNKLEFNLKNPKIWSPDSPNLYIAEFNLYDSDGNLMDVEQVRFGVRSVDWDVAKGFILNGRRTKLRGVCEHLEGGPVGAAWTEGLMRWKLTKIKEMGANAIRTAHNPQLPMFYDLCDELGLMVMDEAFDGWHRKAEHDYGSQAFSDWWETDLKAMVRRDRNHPSVIIYSVGNETSGDVASDLVGVCHEEDHTRLVTSGHSGSDKMDVLGINGNSEKKTFLETFSPDSQVFVGTETPHTWQVRGFYRTQTWYRDGYPNKGQDPFKIDNLTDKEIFGYDWTSPDRRRNVKQIFNSSYDNATVRLTARHNLEYLRDKEWYSGHFRWTGFDYLGEAGYVHGGWPFRAFMGGVIDMAGFEKDHYYLYQSQWRSDVDMVHVLPHWTHPDMKDGTLVPVWAYTTGDSAELFLNGKSFGVRYPGEKWNEMQCEWMVPWEKGEIKVKAFRKGKMIAESVCRTSYTPAFLEITFEKASDADNNVAILSFGMKDRSGNFCPYADNRIYLNLPDSWTVKSFENGNPVDTECCWNAFSRRCFFGLSRAFIDVGKYDDSGILTAGVIAGDRSMKISDTVSVAVSGYDLEGNLVRRVNDYEIYYTLDGTAPDKTSFKYMSPFTVKDGTEIRVAVFYNDYRILDMKETFGKGEGIHWGTPGEAPCETNGIQAEYQVLSGAEIYRDKGDDVYGAGYVHFESDKGIVSFYQENDGSPMNVILKVRYSQQVPQEETYMYVWNNGVLCGRLVFTNTGSDDSDWKYSSCRIELVSGANDIVIKTAGKEAPNIDEFHIIADI